MVEDIIKLGFEKERFATIGEQLARRKRLPSPVRFLSSPFLTGSLLGGLGLLTGTIGVLPALGIAGGIPTVAGVIKKSPRAERLLKEKILRPEEFGGRIGEIIEEPTKPFRKPKRRVEEFIERIKEKPVLPVAAAAVAATAGIAAAPAIIERIRERRGRAEVTALEQQQILPTLIPDLPEIPTPLGAKEVPVEAVAPQVRTPDINISVKPNINVKPRKTEIFINNIMQSI